MFCRSVEDGDQPIDLVTLGVMDAETGNVIDEHLCQCVAEYTVMVF